MVSSLDKSLCSGCMACVSACPINCIGVYTDDMGFFYPKEGKQCLKCGKCLGVCPARKKIDLASNDNKVVYAAVNKNKTILQRSSSGGIYFLIAKKTLDIGGVVVAPVLDDKLNLNHVVINNEEELIKSVGSKYFQSNTSGVYKAIYEQIKNKKQVLFVGTPCQVSGVNAYFDEKFKKSIQTVEIACHGVSSFKIFEKYISEIKPRKKDDVLEINFRDKQKGWENYYVTIKRKSGKMQKEPHNDNLFMRAFLKNYILRSSCYRCTNKEFSSKSDITISDFWGIDVIDPEMYNIQGVSAIYINSARGQRIFEAIKDDIKVKKELYSDAIRYNPAIVSATSKPKDYDEYMSCFVKNYSLNKLDNRFICGSSISIIKKQLKRIVRKIKNLISRYN